jgi:hypothetical protein
MPEEKVWNENKVSQHSNAKVHEEDSCFFIDFTIYCILKKIAAGFDHPIESKEIENE